MTSNVVETRLPRSKTSRVSNGAERPTAAVNQLSRAKQLAESLLSERGEASGAIVARELHEILRILVAEDRSNFQRFLATGFAPDATVVRAAAETYLSGPSAEAAALLAQATDPPRPELLRRMNMAPRGTSAALVAMRKEIAGRLRDEYEGRQRQVYPHVLGHAGREERALAFEYDGSKRSKHQGEWCCLRLSEINDNDIQLQDGPWRTGNYPSTTQRCVDKIYLDADERVPNQPGRRFQHQN